MPSNIPQAIPWPELEAKYKQDIETLTESAEMATIEKEIAEEKLDNCERELQQLKDKLVEANIQIDMLNDRSISAGTSESTVTVLQLQKVEEQNELLKQALIKLRDMSAKDKKALEDLQIEHEELQLKALDLEDREQRYIEQVKNFEEQIDLNQSAQEMVEKLTQQKTELEDKLKEMIEDFDCMEKLRDLNEQLFESARENEIELTGKIDMLRVQCSELNNKKRDLEDYLGDQERTMSKLKEENRLLNEQILELKDQFKDGESLEQHKHQIENVAFKLNFSESKMAEKEAEVNRCRRNLAEIEEQMNNLSLITKEQSARLDELKLQYELKVSENSELQRALKRKMEEVSELEIRKDMAEKKLQSIQNDRELKITSLTRTIETMKGIEIQHEEDMKRLMEDNEIIERERRELRDQLNRSNRSLERTMQTCGNVSMVTAQDTSLASLNMTFSQNAPSPVQLQQILSSPLLQQQQQSGLSGPPITQQISQVSSSPTIGTQLQHSSIMAVQNISSARRLFGPKTDLVDDAVLVDRIRELGLAFDRVSKQNYDLEMRSALNELNNKIQPYNCALSGGQSSHLGSVYDLDRAKRLRASANKLKREIRAAFINQQICTKSRNIVFQTRAEHFSYSKFIVKCQALENEATSLMSNSSLSKGHLNMPLHQSTPVK